jgi:uncharacterized protein YaiE (UPF0345 family)
MAKVVVYVDGKPVSLDSKIVAMGKEAIRGMLEGTVTGIENAEIVIEEPATVGGAPTVRVEKRAAPKSAHAGARTHAAVVEALAAAPDFLNPAILLAAAVAAAEDKGDAEFFVRAARRGDVERAEAEGLREGKAVHRALAALGRSKPESSKTVPVGF